MKKQNKRVWIIRIVAIVLAALMILSVGAVLFQTVFASDGMPPATGSGGHGKVPIIILVVAVVVIAALVLIPSFVKKK